MGDYLTLSLSPSLCVPFRIRMTSMGARGSVVVGALCYKPEGSGFESP
jgi:hypothetical protein